MKDQYLFYREGNYYIPGKFESKGFAVLLGTGFLGVFAVSVVYSYLQYYLTLLTKSTVLFLLVKMFATMAFPLAISYVIALGIIQGKIYHRAGAIIAAFILVLLCLYTQWAVWLFAFFKQQRLILNPVDIIAALRLLEGKIGIIAYGTATSDNAAWIWILEALVIIGYPIFSIYWFLKINPFCPHCNRWTDRKETIYPLMPIGKPQEVKQELEKGNFKVIMDLGKVDLSYSSNFTQLDIQYCSKCSRFHLLNAAIRWESAEFEGVSPIVKNLFISPRTFKKIKSLDFSGTGLEEVLKDESLFKKIIRIAQVVKRHGN